MGQMTFEGNVLRSDLETQGYSLIEHEIPEEMIDGLMASYATFTDNLPEPEAATLNAMMTNPAKLDQLDYSADKQSEWHKYRTNAPCFAKPDGYTNRSLQVETLRTYDRDEIKDKEGNVKKLADDPKEFFHCAPRTLEAIQKQHDQYGWGPIPPEVQTLQLRFNPIHALAQQAIIRTFSLLEEDHPELVPRFLQPKDLECSPLRLLFYHHSDSEELAGGHYDKSSATIQLAESHVGLRVRSPTTQKMEMLRRSSAYGVFFIGQLWKQMYPDSPFLERWHDVMRTDEFNEGRTLHGKRCARWALIWFSNGTSFEVPTKDMTHLETIQAA